MKVYVVTEGCYSDYHICAVFLSEDEAKLYCATMYDADAFDDSFQIEEYDTDADHIEAAPGTKVHYEVYIEKDLYTRKWSSVRMYMTLKPCTPFVFEKMSSHHEGWYKAVLDTDNKDKILKIFRDWRAQKKAEEAGL